jgi:AcrR family transcriptional regulator
MKPKTKEEIIEAFRCSSIEDAALAVLARRGVDHATIQEIADEAGIAKATIYVYFRDRDELLAKTADRAFDRLLEVLGPVLEADMPFADKIMTVVTRQLQFLDEDSALLRAMMALARRDDEVRGKKRQGSHARYAELLEAMFTTARQRGEIGDHDPLRIAAVYRDCLRGSLTRRLEQKPAASVQEEATFIVSILLRGIQA